MLRRLLSRRFFSSAQKKLEEQMHFNRDSYNAVHLTPKEVLDSHHFQVYINDLVQESKTNKTTSIWVHLTNQNLKLIDGLVNHSGFKLHHSKGQETKLYKWMKEDKPDLVPPYSMHIVSCGGIIVKDNQLLLVEEKKGKLKGRFGIPGGRANQDQGIKGCVQREVFEEVGLKGNFKRIMWMRELSGYVYGSYDMYFACLLGLDQKEYEKLKMCNDELASIEWVHLSKLRDFMSSRSFGTQWKLAQYLHELYQKRYNFQDEASYKGELYSSPVDNKERYFGQHFLG